MKYYLSFLLFLLTAISSTLPAQLAFVPAKYDSHQAFWKSKTLVVLEEDEAEYNELLKTAMKKYWTHTPYDFISMEEFLEKRGDAAFSFIKKESIDLSSTSSINPPHGNRYNIPYLVLLMGGKKPKERYRKFDYLSMAMIDNTTNENMVQVQTNQETTTPLAASEPRLVDHQHRLGHMIHFIHQAVQKVKEENISPAAVFPNVKMSRIFIDDYQKEAAQLRRKTLLIEESIFEQDIDGNYFKQNYPYPYKVVTKARIAEAIEAEDKKYCYFLSFKEPNLYFFIVSAADAQIYYADHTGMAVMKISKIDKKEINRMVKVIKK